MNDDYFYVLATFVAAIPFIWLLCGIITNKNRLYSAKEIAMVASGPTLWSVNFVHSFLYSFATFLYGTVFLTSIFKFDIYFAFVISIPISLIQSLPR